MTTRPGAGLRRRVVERAAGRCEYCRIPQEFAATAHQVDHVIAEKHSGRTTFENLALSCMVCDLRKASDIASLDPQTGQLAARYNPRMPIWSDHFSLNGVEIVGLTADGRASIEFLRLNSYERLVERAELIAAGAWP